MKHGKNIMVSLKTESDNMKNDDVYSDLVIDLVSNCGMNMFDARKLVNYLRGEGILDSDTLKKYYFEARR